MRGFSARVYEALTGARAVDVSPDEPGNWRRHAGALTLTKSADGLFDPKLVKARLAVALTMRGAAAAWVAAELAGAEE